MSGPARWGFGLAIDAQDGIELPELIAVDRPATVTVRRAAGPAPAPSGPLEERERDPGATAWIEHVPGHEYRYVSRADGVFIVTANGRQVTCHPRGDAWIELLGMQVLPLAATLQGIEVFHASAVVTGGAAAMLTGPSGAGKTTLAAHLVARGAELLADDVVAVVPTGDGPSALAGTQHLRLRAAEAERLSAAHPGRFAPVGTQAGKVVVDAGGRSTEAPLARLYLLERVAAGEGPAIEDVPAVSPALLLGATFNLSVRESARRLRQLDVCEQIARHVSVRRVRIAPDVDAAELAARLHDDLKAAR